MLCGAFNKDGTQCLKNTTTRFSIFPTCTFHGEYAKKYQMDQGKKSYQKGFQDGRSYLGD